MMSEIAMFKRPIAGGDMVWDATGTGREIRVVETNQIKSGIIQEIIRKMKPCGENRLTPHTSYGFTGRQHIP
jgi:hypothetical protein